MLKSRKRRLLSRPRLQDSATCALKGSTWQCANVDRTIFCLSFGTIVGEHICRCVGNCVLRSMSFPFMVHGATGGRTPGSNPSSPLAFIQFIDTSTETTLLQWHIMSFSSWHLFSLEYYIHCTSQSTCHVQVRRDIEYDHHFHAQCELHFVRSRSCHLFPPPLLGCH